MDNKIKKLQKTFELRSEIADLHWHWDTLIKLEQSFVDEEEYEKAQTALMQRATVRRKISKLEKQLKEYEDTL